MTGRPTPDSFTASDGLKMRQWMNVAVSAGTLQKLCEDRVEAELTAEAGANLMLLLMLLMGQLLLEQAANERMLQGACRQLLC